jgi:flavin-dependent dehydrogenase
MSDISVIGGGPAGSASAIRLARNGLKVRLFEKSHFPRPKLCGGFLSPESLADLDDLGVLDDLKRAGIYPIRRTVIASRRGTVIEFNLPEETFAVSRSVLDDLLLRQAAREGVDVHEGEDGLAQSPTGYTVMATGRLPKGDPDFLTRPLSPWYAGSGVTYVGIQALFRDMPAVSDQVELDLIESGYVGLARQNEGVNVCALTTQDMIQKHGPSLDRVLAHFSEENPILRAHLHKAERISPWLSVSPMRLGIRQLVGEKTFYVGDAACVLDPFAGEGMAVGLYSARLLASALQTAAPEDAYARLWHRAFDSAIAWNAVMRLFYSVGVFREPILRALRLYPMAMNWLNDLTRYRRLEGIQ